MLLWKEYTIQEVHIYTPFLIVCHFSSLASFPGSLTRWRTGVDESLVSTALPRPVVFDM